MQDDEVNELLASFNDLPDPRSERNQHHPLLSIFFIALCGAISGADNWVEIEAMGIQSRVAENVDSLTTWHSIA